MADHISKLQQSIEPLRQQIINHKVYSAITELEDLRVFMQYHIFAVWDFMSLLKALQNNLTCTTVPWFPKGSAETRHLINEIVLGEEADIDENGDLKSHFELYLEAMQQSGADIIQIEKFISALKSGSSLAAAFEISDAPKATRDFVNFTFDIINSGKDYLQAATFTFGREDLIPNMFHSIVNDIGKTFPNEVSIFKYYLERHIEIDGDHHSNLALLMTSNLCEENETFWKEAEVATIQSLQKRIDLWDAVYDQIAFNKAISN
ncbi:DUF3050 domain-containing protein [Dyadobacter sp. LHD-138]|uniref:DUF3050 domain-containing protein n=1 Tax=Dyadobacter sp. LHD-138 TaxID=3071413 RepID=UPI0027E1EC7C|nr:DUF3050 domain-containing protein [Dyadobacter sp. LHD-138]MDQ6478420.1 DUF3050 domain-containing protein [Dyadobacter sp. LHD-138]